METETETERQAETERERESEYCNVYIADTTYRQTNKQTFFSLLIRGPVIIVVIVLAMIHKYVHDG